MAKSSHFGHLGGLLGSAVEIAGRDAGSQRFLVSVQKVQSSGLHLARIAGETVVLLVLSRLSLAVFNWFSGPRLHRKIG